MTVDVEYEVDSETPEAEVPLLSARLSDSVQSAFYNGTITDDLGAYVEDYSITVERMFAS